MRFIQQLTETINPQLSSVVASVSRDNMLEQFYAIYIMRLCDKALLAELSILPDTANFFEKIWSEQTERDIICQELSLSHHLKKDKTLKLISASSPLIYQQIKQQANKENLPIFDFLQQHINDIKTLFPIWIDLVIAQEILSAEPQADVQVENLNDTANIDNNNANINNNIDNQEQAVYPELLKSNKKSKRKKGQALRRKKPANSQDATQHKKILTIAIVLLILNLMIVGVLLWLKKISDAETEVILTPEQAINNEPSLAKEPEKQVNSQDIAVFSAKPSEDKDKIPTQAPQENGKNGTQFEQANSKNIVISSAQPIQAVPPAQANNQGFVMQPAPPAQATNQNMAVPPAQPAQPMNVPPNRQSNIPPPAQQMPIYNEPAIVNPPPQQPMPNERVFEFGNDRNDYGNNGGISEAEFKELTNVEIVAEDVENQAE